jgi:hypothetical protein
MNLGHNPHTISLRSILILSFYLYVSFHNSLFFQGLPPKSTSAPIPSFDATRPAHLILLDLVILILFDEECNLWIFSLCNAL